MERCRPRGGCLPCLSTWVIMAWWAMPEITLGPCQSVWFIKAAAFTPLHCHCWHPLSLSDSHLTPSLSPPLPPFSLILFLFCFLSFSLFFFFPVRLSLCLCLSLCLSVSVLPFLLYNYILPCVLYCSFSQKMCL